MTSFRDFEQSFDKFRALVYPDYPKSDELRDWNSNLLTFDSYIAGYLTRVRDGTLSAHEVPDLDGSVSEIASLRSSLDSLRPLSGQDGRLIDEYRHYVTALEDVLAKLQRLASPEM